MSGGQLRLSNKLNDRRGDYFTNWILYWMLRFQMVSSSLSGLWMVRGKFMEENFQSDIDFEALRVTMERIAEFMKECQ